MNGSNRVLIGSVCVLVLADVAGVFAQVPDPIAGTYSFAVCAERCRTPDDPDALVSGRLVLTSSTIPLSAFADSTLHGLQLGYYEIELATGAEPNACHVTDERGGMRRSLAGFERVGVSRWIRSDTDHRVRFGMLWSGIDAQYYVEIEEEAGGMLRGRGYPSSSPTGGEMAPEYFVAERVGEPRAAVCTDLAPG